MLYAKVNAVALLRFVNEEIFQRIVAVGWGKRFFAELAVNPTCRMLRLRPHANELISRCALRTKEIDGFGHERLPQSWSPRHMSARRQCQRGFKHTADLGHSPLPMPSPPERRCLIFAPRLRVVCPTPDSWRAKFESSVLRGSVAGVSRRAYRHTAARLTQVLLATALDCTPAMDVQRIPTTGYLTEQAPLHLTASTPAATPKLASV